MKVVLDTNVLIAAFATRGLCESVLELCLERCEVVLSEAILAEVHQKLQSKLRLPSGSATEIVEFLRHHSDRVQPTSVAPGACRDPDHLPILGTAEAAGAAFLVTSDRDLLALEAFNGIPIVTPRQFWEALEAESSKPRPTPASPTATPPSEEMK